MKTSTLLIALVVGFLTTSVSAQETLWFDANWNPTTKDKATYYRPSPKTQKNGYWIVDYFMNGTIQMEGFSLNNNPNNENFHGLVKYYFESGVIYQEVNYNEGMIDGDRKIYYKSGKLQNEREYEDNKMEGKFFEYYETGELLMTGKYENNLKEGVWKSYYKNGKIKERGKYEKGKKIGIWKTFYKNVYKK
jgi:antitoxin component YwqK of YwqJK toxin-antitoxin module